MIVSEFCNYKEGMNMDKKIQKFVEKVRARLREQAVLDAVIMSVSGGLFLAMLISILSLWIPLYYAIPLSGGVVLLFFAAGIVWGITKTPSPEKSALMKSSRSASVIGCCFNVKWIFVRKSYIHTSLVCFSGLAGRLSKKITLALTPGL